MENLTSNNDLIQLTDNIILARYGRKAKNSIDIFEEKVGLTRETITLILNRLEELIENPIIYNNYKIPESIKNNRQILIPELKNRIKGILDSSDADLIENFKKLFIDFNWLVKYVTNKWMLANAGLALEITEVSSKLEPSFQNWLNQNFGIEIGDAVLHRHVISNKERGQLQEMGIDTPYDHWDKQYYIDTMNLAKQIVESNPQNKGILSDGSWTYNPRLYENASDGKPFVSFTFLSDDRLTGHRFFLMKAIPGNVQENQYLFAIRSERRKLLVEN